MKQPVALAISCAVACVLGAGGFVGAACGTFSGSDSSSASAEAGGDATQSGTSDSSLPNTADATTTDAGADATGADATSATTPSSPCVGAEHWLCDDFDRDGSIIGFPYWSSAGITGDASVEIVEPNAPVPPSPPNALASVAYGNQGAVLYAGYNQASRGFRCEASFRIDQRGQAQVLLLVLSLYGAQQQYYRLQLSALSQDEVDEYGGFPDGSPIGVSALAATAFTDKVWTHVSLDATFGDGGALHYFLNGVDQKIQSKIDLSALGTPLSSTLQLGVAPYAGGGSWTVLYDDAVCDPIP
jgi:hypothetical protein